MYPEPALWPAWSLRARSILHGKPLAGGFGLILLALPWACTSKPSLDRLQDSTPTAEGDADSDSDSDADTDTDTDADVDIVLDTGLPDTGPWRQVSVGSQFACGIRSDQTVLCWGDDFYNQLDVPMQTFSSVVSDIVSSCGILTDGSVSCWGDLEYPYPLPGGFFRRLDGYWGAYCGIRDDGAIECWGQTDDTPIPILTSGSYLALSVGHESMCAIENESVTPVDCWGQYDWWELPASPPENSAFLDVCLTEFFGCTLDADHELVCFGDESLYNGERLADIALMGPFVDLSCSRLVLCLIDARGTLHVLPEELTEVPADLPGTWSRVDCGAGGTCALATDGSITCWGDPFIEDVPG